MRMVRNWSIVWVGNFAGAMLLAWMMSQTGLFGTAAEPSAIGQRAAALGNSRLDLTVSFSAWFFRGVLCNMLVCLAVMIAVSARTVTGKILGVYFPIMAFVAAGLEHSIANMYFLSAGLMAQGQLGEHFWGMFTNLIPVTLGNLVGGLALVFLHPKSQQMSGRLFRRVTRRTAS
jgi:formate/nitrite transporter